MALFLHNKLGLQTKKSPLKQGGFFSELKNMKTEPQPLLVGNR
jgi:hypothetical protein